MTEKRNRIVVAILVGLMAVYMLALQSRQSSVQPKPTVETKTEKAMMSDEAKTDRSQR